jgi:hypothetical protein
MTHSVNQPLSRRSLIKALGTTEIKGKLYQTGFQVRPKAPRRPGRT